jgi:NADH-quinone oxidoreductase subunit L
MVRRFAQQRFKVDELYDIAIIRPLKGLSVLLYRVVDALLIDTVAVRGTAWLTNTSGSLLRYLQTGDAQGYAAVMALALAGGLLWALWGRF